MLTFFAIPNFEILLFRTKMETYRKTGSEKWQLKKLANMFIFTSVPLGFTPGSEDNICEQK